MRIPCAPKLRNKPEPTPAPGPTRTLTGWELGQPRLPPPQSYRAGSGGRDHRPSALKAVREVRAGAKNKPQQVGGRGPVPSKPLGSQGRRCTLGDERRFELLDLCPSKRTACFPEQYEPPKFTRNCLAPCRSLTNDRGASAPADTDNHLQPRRRNWAAGGDNDLGGHTPPASPSNKPTRG